MIAPDLACGPFAVPVVEVVVVDRLVRAAVDDADLVGVERDRLGLKGEFGSRVDLA